MDKKMDIRALGKASHNFKTPETAPEYSSALRSCKHGQGYKPSGSMKDEEFLN
jgi:hypothetical protein